MLRLEQLGTDLQREGLRRKTAHELIDQSLRSRMGVETTNDMVIAANNPFISQTELEAIKAKALA